MEFAHIDRTCRLSSRSLTITILLLCLPIAVQSGVSPAQSRPSEWAFNSTIPLGTDLLVLQPSAWAHEGRGKRMRFPIEHYYHLGGANHFDLLNHPAIVGQMRRCLASPRALPAGEGNFRH